jgi:hypothetical protein
MPEKKDEEVFVASEQVQSIVQRQRRMAGLGPIPACADKRMKSF